MGEGAFEETWEYAVIGAQGRRGTGAQGRRGVEA